MCQLRWDWEIKIPEAPHFMVFVVPSIFVKNGEDRLVICNQIARSVIESQRGKHVTHVFTYRSKPITGMNMTAWRSARKRANLVCVRVHDLKHTCGRRLRAAGVSVEDRQDLLGHRSERMTTHYSSAELNNLHIAANKICETHESGISVARLRHINLVRISAEQKEMRTVVYPILPVAPARALQ